MNSKNTKPELAIRKILYSKGYRYKIHHKKLPGKPDIVLTKLKTIINVHGCYWHYHGCEKSCIPKTRSEYWLTRLEDNKKRDFMEVINLFSDQILKLLLMFKISVKTVLAL